MTMTPTARSKTPAPPPAEDVRADAEVAADRFVTAVRCAIDRLPESSDLNVAANELTEAWRQVGADAGPVLAAASAAVGVFWNRGRVIDVTVRRADAAGHLPAVVAAVDQALVTFEQRDQLSEARRTVTRLEAERAEVLADLERAVASADVDRVLELRPELEVRLPAAQDAARLALATLELARAEAQRDRPRGRAEDAARAEMTARARLEAAQVALREATAAAETAVQQRLVAEHVAAQTDAQVRELAAEVERLRQANAQSLADRLRKLAGLPATPTTTNNTNGASS